MSGTPTILAALMYAAAAAAAPVELRHEPLTCVPANRYALVTASAVPPAAGASANLQFRTDPGGGWYAIAMTNENGGWTARLPRPTPSLQSFEYRVVVTSTATDATVSQPVRVRVSAGCEAAGTQPSIATPIVVKVPDGAPVVPPVPGGFSPAGVVAAQPPRKPRFTAGTIARDAGIVLAGAAAVKVIGATGFKPRDRAPDIPSFAFTGTSPPPGSVLSLSSGTLVVFMVMDHEPEQPLTLQWRVDLLHSPSGPACAFMQSVFNGAQRPAGLALTAPLTSTHGCGDRFEVTNARLVISVGGGFVYDAVHALPFRIEP